MNSFFPLVYTQHSHPQMYKNLYDYQSFPLLLSMFLLLKDIIPLYFIFLKNLRHT